MTSFRIFSLGLDDCRALTLRYVNLSGVEGKKAYGRRWSIYSFPEDERREEAHVFPFVLILSIPLLLCSPSRPVSFETTAQSSATPTLFLDQTTSSLAFLVTIVNYDNHNPSFHVHVRARTHARTPCIDRHHEGYSLQRTAPVRPGWRYSA